MARASDDAYVTADPAHLFIYPAPVDDGLFAVRPVIAERGVVSWSRLRARSWRRDWTSLLRGGSRGSANGSDVQEKSRHRSPMRKERALTRTSTHARRL
jgi:hypothetical protein